MRPANHSVALTNPRKRRRSPHSKFRSLADALERFVRHQSSDPVNLLRASSFAIAAPESITRSANSSAPLNESHSPDTNSAAAALILTKSNAASRRSPESTATIVSAFSSGEAPRNDSTADLLNPKSSGAISNLRNPDGVASTTAVGPLNVISSNPSKPRTTHARRVPSRTSAPAIFSAAASSETPATWNGVPAGLVKGPSRLNIVRTPSARRTWATLFVAA